MTRRLLVALLLVAACGHSGPFEVEPPATGGPVSGTPPLRLTYNIGQDGWVSWSEAGDAFFYSVQDSFTVDKDRCIARLPALGGRSTRLACPLVAAGNFFTEIYDQPTVRNGVLAYASSELGVDEHSPFRIAVWTAVDTPFATPTQALTFPYTTPSNHNHDAPLFLQWIAPSTLLYIGAENGCCRKDTMRFGEQIVVATLGPGGPTRSFVPNTTRASAVSASADGLTIYYTIAGHSEVLRQVLASGVVDTVFDFGPGLVARDPQVLGGRLVAVVGGHDGFTDLPPFYGVQIDYGGRLLSVDLGTGTQTRLGDTLHLYKRPKFSPDGSRLVVEGYPLTISAIHDSVGNVTFADTAVSRWADLWLMEE